MANPPKETPRGTSTPTAPTPPKGVPANTIQTPYGEPLCPPSKVGG